MGITKDGILRLDERTKEIMQTWPLEQVKRWAATQNIFTIDFGDYSEGFYSVQTPDGDKISEIVAGYIDLLAKNKPKFGPGGMGDGTTQEPIESDGTSGKKGATQIEQGSVKVSKFNYFIWNMDFKLTLTSCYMYQNSIIVHLLAWKTSTTSSTQPISKGFGYYHSEWKESSYRFYCEFASPCRSYGRSILAEVERFST